MRLRLFDDVRVEENRSVEIPWCSLGGAFPLRIVCRRTRGSTGDRPRRQGLGAQVTDLLAE